MIWFGRVKKTDAQTRYQCTATSKAKGTEADNNQERGYRQNARNMGTSGAAEVTEDTERTDGDG